MEAGKVRFPFIDQFRGLIVALMALDHSSGFFNAIWKSQDMFDPYFASFGQFAVRYSSYLCAPGFLILNGAVSWYSFTRRVASGHSQWSVKWHMIQRGLFLVLLQVTWVNASWLGFRQLNPAHLGIIACIGISMCLLALFLNARWQVRLAVGLLALVVHPFLLRIPYETGVFWQRALMQTFVDAGDWNKYPVIPWFALSTLGSVIGQGWFSRWKNSRQKIAWSLSIGLAGFVLATAIRMGRGFGNLTIFDKFGHYSFFLDPKYPPSLFHLVWCFGAVILVIGLIELINLRAQWAVNWLSTYGRVPLFFYCMHIAILSVVAERFGVYNRQGGVWASLIGWVALLIVMYPLSRWFGRVKARSKNPIIQMI